MCRIIFLHLIVLHCPPLFVTTNLGGVETYCLQTVVASAEYSFHGHDTVDAGFGAVAAVDVVSKTLVGNMWEYGIGWVGRVPTWLPWGAIGDPSFQCV